MTDQLNPLQENNRWEVTILPEKLLTRIPDTLERGKYHLEPSKPIGQALIIAHAKYALPDPDFEKAVDSDVKRMASLLYRYGYSVSIWYEQSSSELKTSWDAWISDHARPAAKLFLYFSGHGYSKEAEYSEEAEDSEEASENKKRYIKDYIFIAGSDDTSANEFTPFKSSSPQKGLHIPKKNNAKETEANQETETSLRLQCVCSCILCIDTCLEQPKGRSNNPHQKPISEALRTLRDSHQLVTVFFDEKVQLEKSDRFSNNLEQSLRRAIRAITLEALKTKETVRQRSSFLYVKHNQLLEQLIDINQEPFLNDSMVAHGDCDIFQIDILAFGQELLREEYDRDTVDWVRQYFKRFLMSKNIEERKWGWLSQLIAFEGDEHKGGKKLLAQVEKLNQLINQVLPPSIEINNACQGLYELLDVSKDNVEHWNHINNYYKIKGVLERINRYSSSKDGQILTNDITSDIKLVKEVFDFYDSFKGLCDKLCLDETVFIKDIDEKLSYCRQLTRLAYQIPFEDLDTHNKNIHMDTAHIIEMCQKEAFLDQIRLLRQLGAILNSKYAQATPTKQAQWVMSAMCSKPGFWFLGILLYAVLLLITTIILIATGTLAGSILALDNKAWPLQVLIVFAGFYSSAGVFVFFFTHNRHIRKNWADSRLFVPVLLNVLFSVLLAIVASRVVVITHIAITAMIWIIFISIGIATGIVGFQEYEHENTPQ